MISNVLDVLLERVDDTDLQAWLASEVERLRDAKEFGLVFEKHIPETARLYSYPLRRGTKVQSRTSDSSETWVVKQVESDQVTLISGDGEEVTRAADELVAVRAFGDAIYPGLREVGTVERGEGKPFHAVINAENYHALEALLFGYEGEVDLIYIDPPYNTGARDWKYSNDYVDANDRYRHSKWLSFMERRLLLAKRLLKQDGVLVVTVDENEVSHLGVLLEELFPDALRQMVTIVINPSGASGEGLDRVEEYAYFCFLGETPPVPVADDLLTGANGGKKQKGTAGSGLTWESLLRRGNVWYRAKRKNLCYPVILSKDEKAIVGVGEPWEPPVKKDGSEDEAARPLKTDDGKPLAWPVRKDGRLGIWRVDGARLMWLVERGYGYVSQRDHTRGTWALKYLLSGTVDAIEEGAIEVIGKGDRGQVMANLTAATGKTAKTVWVRGRHIAGGSGGTQMLSALLGEKGKFTYPKSLYAVMDTIEVAIGDRKDAVILDFFAGSGTTLHATAVLNERDGGHRRAIIVTNNEVAEDVSTRLLAEGKVPGSEEFERYGVFWSVAKPRCEAAVTGVTPQGDPVEGEYNDDTPIADGLAENVAFFELTYLDRNDVARGGAFDEIAPLLWLAAGATGEVAAATGAPFVIPEGSRYAVLFDVAAWRDFADLIDSRPQTTHVFVVTDSLAQFQQVAAELPPGLRVSMLWDDYLRHFDESTGG